MYNVLRNEITMRERLFLALPGKVSCSMLCSKSVVNQEISSNQVLYQETAKLGSEIRSVLLKSGELTGLHMTGRLSS